MDDLVEDDRGDLDAAALAFQVTEELDESLAAVWTNPTDLVARSRLRDYLDSPRLSEGTAAITKLNQIGGLAS